MGRMELVIALYGGRIDPEAGENRLKNLLNRVRKKYPGLIVTENGRYRIGDPELLPWTIKKTG
ncbi:MAG: hypothetical protein HUU37_01935 [Bdellovibrionales bacterium]|nr:hypothetical protein [Bdellovibrionales bacterium]